jgi:hypothetical protein
MNSLKRIDENTILLKGVYYTTNIAKKAEIRDENVNLIYSVKLNSVNYYPYKEEKNNQKK